MSDNAAKATPRKPGRPSLFSPEVATEICERLSDGNSLATICKDESMPSRRSVLMWMNQDPNFCASIARARSWQADHLADEIVSLADNCTDPHKARLQVDARKWYASKLAPKKYGDKIDITTKDETPPLSRAEMIAHMRHSPAFLQEVEMMIAEARNSEQVTPATTIQPPFPKA